jgi:hypothetical protein
MSYTGRKTSVRHLPLDENGHASFPRKEDALVMVISTVDDPIPHVILYPDRCRFCDYYPVFEVTDDLVRLKDPCPLPNGVTTVTEVSFRSGKIIVNDSLCPIYDWESYKKGRASYNSALGAGKVIQEMAELGCAYGPVIGGCPDLYRTGEGTYIIATPAYNPCVQCEGDGSDADADCTCDDERPIPGAEKLFDSSMGFGLWAYSIADYADWEAKSQAWIDAEAGDKEREKRRERIKDRVQYADVIDFPPGTYRFTHHSGEKGFVASHDTSDMVIYAHVERIGD